MQKASIICSTYNSLNNLKIVLDSLCNQSIAKSEYEIIIADDGSTKETAILIKTFQTKFPNFIKHVWQEDNGWKKCKIHNKSILEADGELLVFIDGDCIAHPTFLEDHINIFNKNKTKYVCMGRRIDLSNKISKNLNLENYINLLFQFNMTLFYSYLKHETRNYFRKFSIKNKLLRILIQADNVNDLLGSNFSLPKESMVLINGFNQDMERGEDGDIFIRLRNSGHKLIGKKYFAVNFHLFHKRGDYQYVDDYYKLNLLPRTDYVWAKNGLK